jgi:hypothetical protein
MPYVQPQLAPDRQPVEWLMLMVWRPSLAGAAVVDAATIRAFLREFHLALGVADPDTVPAFRMMLAALRSPEIEVDELTVGRHAR